MAPLFQVPDAWNDISVWSCPFLSELSGLSEIQANVYIFDDNVYITAVNFLYR